ncbi:glycosyltransferase family 9 protein [Aureliella helgolandensis]|uniref:glycosyltransferase family 9 protein n=1 Tax=Aureliella helgolandensis TaxID=2527968 RepID=UPI001E3DDB6E|nr:glycosyltransferase family 9 protein [Aureliella helgolandensis]
MGLRIMDGTRRDTPKSVLLTRLSAIGDCILTIPLAVEIKRLWPHCTLTWIVDCAAASLLESHPAVDEVIRIPKQWLKSPTEWSSLRQELRAREFDFTFDPQGLSKSATLGWLSGARRRIGFDYSHARELAPLLATRRIRRTARHMVDTYRQLLSPWTPIEMGQGSFDMPVYRDAALQVEELLDSLEWNAWDRHNWVAINPGAGWPTKTWPVQRFGMLARELHREYGRRSIVLWAGEDELLKAKVIEEESRGAAFVAPATDLPQALEVIRRSSLLVTADTGPLHMASAVGTPCVSLHGPTWADESGPYGNRHIAIQSPLLPHPKKVARRGHNVAMQAIELDDVFHACGQLLTKQAISHRLIA